MRVFAREGITVSYYGADGVRIPHKRITSRGLTDHRAGRTAEGPVEVPETDYYLHCVAAGDLVRANGAVREDNG